MLMSRLLSKLSGDSAFSMADQFLVSGLNFAIGIMAARIVGVSDFGLFTIVLVFVSLGATAVENLLTVPMMTLAGSRPRRSNSYFVAVFRLSLIGCCFSAVFVAVVIAAILAGRGDSVSLEIIAASATLAFGHNTLHILRSVLFARRQNARALKLDAARLALLSSSVALLYFGQWEVGAALLFIVIGLSALLVSLPDIVSALRWKVKGSLFRNVLSRHWPYAKWMLLMMVVSMGQEQLVWVIAGIQLGDAAVGALRAGQYLLGATHFILHSLEFFMPRHAAQSYYIGGYALLRSYIWRQTILFSIFLGIILVLISLFSAELLYLAFGPEYVPFATYTQVFAMAYFVVTVRGIWEKYLRTIERTDLIFWSSAVSSLCAVAIIYPMMNALGVVGVAWTVVIAHLVCLLCVAISVLYTWRTEPKRDRGSVLERIRSGVQPAGS